MLALTLQSPWPFAFVELGKRLENRGWSPSQKRLPIGGIFALHGGAEPSARTKELRHRDFARGLALAGPEAVECYKTHYHEIRGIFALAVYGGFEVVSDSPWFVAPKAWVIRDLFPLSNRAGRPRPIECPGAQGLWQIPDWALIQIKHSRAWHDALDSYQPHLINFGEEPAWHG